MRESGPHLHRNRCYEPVTALSDASQAQTRQIISGLRQPLQEPPTRITKGVLTQPRPISDLRRADGRAAESPDKCGWSLLDSEQPPVLWNTFQTVAPSIAEPK